MRTEEGVEIFTFQRAHAGQCVAGELMMVRPESYEDRLLTHWLAWAIARASEVALTAGRQLPPALQGQPHWLN